MIQHTDFPAPFTCTFQDKVEFLTLQELLWTHSTLFKVKMRS